VIIAIRNQVAKLFLRFSAEKYVAIKLEKEINIYFQFTSILIDSSIAVVKKNEVTIEKCFRNKMR